jgi:hypothetical protein
LHTIKTELLAFSSKVWAVCREQILAFRFQIVSYIFKFRRNNSSSFLNPYVSEGINSELCTLGVPNVEAYITNDEASCPRKCNDEVQREEKGSNVSIYTSVYF